MEPFCQHGQQCPLCSEPPSTHRAGQLEPGAHMEPVEAGSGCAGAPEGPVEAGPIPRSAAAQHHREGRGWDPHLTQLLPCSDSLTCRYWVFRER